MFLDLKQLLNIGQDEIVFGLDIGSSAVKLIQMHKDNTGYAVTAAGVAEIAAGVAEIAAGIAEIAAGEGSEDNSKINTVKAISECLRSTETQTQLAVCGVSGPEVAVRYFSFPSLPPEEIEGAVLLEAAQICPFNVGDAS
ncbi:unnamed protein product, partial [marine sediment metagenome]